ncbi:DUF4129 domain-containing protein [Ornithinibacillus halotolerans]|uniref:DUF4129 domain-containing protein n=1 Tax=Ornithinibacillus halotolerans TaxID=1274357 RepID=A0A916S634_9BACI|nr:DUF4129 domain-containing protein [Ornithinibacillus halotolerans]GGA82830.1 hypothetical protein GCM10008025_27460 [Ornithinibacillus halotolerans]
MIDIDRAREKIDQIVNTREYQLYYEDNRNFLQRWWDSVKEWFMELFETLFGSITPSSGLASAVVVIVSIVVLIAVFLAIFLVIRYYRRKHHYKDTTELFRTHEKDWTYDDHIKKAKGEEEKENLQNATRHLFLALLLFFREKGFIETRIWKTNTDYYTELTKVNRQTAIEFYKLANQFDAVVYGEQRVEVHSYQQYKQTVLHLIETPPESDLVNGLGGDNE